MHVVEDEKFQNDWRLFFVLLSLSPMHLVVETVAGLQEDTCLQIRMGEFKL
jgi:hypothetical protein